MLIFGDVQSMLDKEFKNLLLDYSAKFRLSNDEKETIKQIIKRLKDYDTQSKATFWCDLNSDYFWTTEPRVTKIVMDYIADQISYKECYTLWQSRHDL